MKVFIKAIFTLFVLRAFLLGATVFIGVLAYAFFTESSFHTWVDWLESSSDREKLPKMTFKQIKNFALLDKVKKGYLWEDIIYKCDGDEFTFINFKELMQFKKFFRQLEKEKSVAEQNKIQAEFLKHLQTIVNKEYDKVLEEVTLKSENESEFKDELEKFSKSKGIVELKPLPDNDRVRVELPLSKNEEELKELRDEVEALKAKYEFNDSFRLAVLKSQTQIPYYEHDITWNATNENYKWI